jgi:hypothetical protein
MRPPGWKKNAIETFSLIELSGTFAQKPPDLTGPILEKIRLGCKN